MGRKKQGVERVLEPDGGKSEQGKTPRKVTYEQNLKEIRES